MEPALQGFHFRNCLQKTGTMSQILNFEMLCYWEEGDWKEFIQFDRLFVILTVDR